MQHSARHIAVTRQSQEKLVSSMAKGSQLAQLKAALSQAGVTGNTSTNKKRKRQTAPLEKEKEKRAARLEEIQRRLNPFDVKVTKLKHDVGGRKLKGVSGKPSKSKQAGIEQVGFRNRFKIVS
jgi:nucleolar protein 14